MKKKFILFAIVLILTPIFAKEPEGIIIGVGVGEGYSKFDIKHSQFARYPILGTGANGFPQGQPVMTAKTNFSADSWGLAWEFLVGYKHFINDYIGFRYYANVGIQHYTPAKELEPNGKKDKIGLIDYTLNADILFDFYNSESWAFGIFGGVGFGGTNFNKNATNQYLDTYNVAEGIPMGASAVKENFFNVNASAGARIVIFQSISTKGGGSCDRYSQGRRVCSTQTSFIGHNFEVVAKFNLLTYNATDYDIMLSTTGNNRFLSRPSYEISNPYRITFRYIIEF